MIEVHVPKLFPTLSERDWLKIEKWHVREGDIIQPNQLMVSIEGAPGYFDIPTPPSVDKPHRIVHINVKEGQETKLGDLLITLEPTTEERM